MLKTKLFLVLIILFTGSSIFASQPWVKEARTAGINLIETMQKEDIDRISQKLLEQKVNTVLVYSSISFYLPEDDYEVALSFIRMAAERFHKNSLKVIWSYSCLQQITAEGKKREHSVFKDHPDWLQMNWDRKSLNYQYQNIVYAKEKNDETAWLCPNSDYKNYISARISKLSQAGIDGICLDMVSFYGLTGIWPCTDKNCIGKMWVDIESGLPEKVDFSNMEFKKWILWRHRTLADFTENISNTVKNTAPQVQVFLMNYGCSGLSSTIDGLDGAYIAPDIDFIWQVNPISSMTGMSSAREDDWISMMLMFKYCQGLSYNKSQLALNFGFKEEDAQLVMALGLAAQCNPLESRVGGVTASVGRRYRQKMYKWVETNSDYIFKSESKAKVLVVYSGRNRDLVDGYKSGGVYATPYGDGLLQGWTVNSFKESVKSMDYLAEHRGYVEMLIKLCIPFDMAELSSLPARVDLDKYKLMVLPEALSMSELETQKILSFIENGGNLYISGKDTGKLNQWGVSVSSCVFKEMKKKTSGFEDSWLVKEKGKYYFAGENSGKKFLNKKDKSIIKAFARKAKEIDVLPVAQNNSSLYVQVYEYNGKYIVSLVNYAWAGTKDKKVKSVEANISLPLPDGYTAGKVYAAYPENEGIEELKFVQEGNVVKVSAIVSINALIVISR